MYCHLALLYDSKNEVDTQPDASISNPSAYRRISTAASVPRVSVLSSYTSQPFDAAASFPW